MLPPQTVKKLVRPAVQLVLKEGFALKSTRIWFHKFGTAKYIINSNVDKELLDYSLLTLQQTSIINEVILETKSLYWNDFIDHVYSTYPIVHSERYSDLDLVSLAEEESR